MFGDDLTLLPLAREHLHAIFCDDLVARMLLLALTYTCTLALFWIVVVFPCLNAALELRGAYLHSGSRILLGSLRCRCAGRRLCLRV